MLDYHQVIKTNSKFVDQSTIGDVSGRTFVDSAPILDRAWAAKSGLGWIGKIVFNHSKVGLFYCELIVDLELSTITQPQIIVDLVLLA
jgi:epoxyqueuosine reductase